MFLILSDFFNSYCGLHRLLYFQELSNKEELCVQMQEALEKCRGNYSVATHQQVSLFIKNDEKLL